MNSMLQLEKIRFTKDKEALCVFPNDLDELERGLLMMGIQNRPVIVLIGGHILPEHDAVHRRALEVIARTAEEIDAVIICGGTDVGVMAMIGEMRASQRSKFPLVGIAPENLVTWPGGPQDIQPALPEGKRAPLQPHHSHFVLVPGNEFGDESPWIVRAATFIAGDRHRAITILANGGEVSKKDIKLALAADRPVIVLKGTGRLADEIAHQPRRSSLLKIVRAEDKVGLVKSILALLR